ncbi:MAG: hypothetical protein U9R08_02980 [Nanoarchaeota archaeon]|nr:hypothetical protein [Nanoarchaeota archaeon]
MPRKQHPEDLPTYSGSTPLRSLKQELFCHKYITPGKTFSNGRWSYMFSYFIDWIEKHLLLMRALEKMKNVDDRDITCNTLNSELEKKFNVCDVASSNILSFIKVQARIEYLKVKYLKMTDELADAELASVIKQNKDLSNKMASIREYNRLRSRGSEGNVNIVFNDELRNFNDDDLYEELKRRKSKGSK